MSNITAGCVGALIGLIIGFVIGRFSKNRAVRTFYDYLNGVFKNLENYVLCVSGLIVVVSTILSVMGNIEAFASVTINIFGSVVFSWLLTKKSSKGEFREHEQDLAMRAYRHINYLDTAANSAYKSLEEYYNDQGIDKETKLILNNAMSQIRYIQGGINTCKMDWVDMLSPEQQSKCMDRDYDSQTDDYGTVKVVEPDTQYNQEDA